MESGGIRICFSRLISYHSIHPKCSASLPPGLLTDLRMSPTFPIFVFAHVLPSPYRVVLHPIPNLTLWAWSPDAILITCAHLPLSNCMWSLNSVNVQGQERRLRGEGGREEWTEFPIAFLNSPVTNSYYARQNFLFIHLTYFPYKNKGSLKASAMFHPFFYNLHRIWGSVWLIVDAYYS